MPSAKPLQRDSWFVEPGCVFTHSTFFEPLLAEVLAAAHAGDVLLAADVVLRAKALGGFHALTL